jgi:hypothetical protein
MPATIGANLARRRLANDELVLCLGINRLRTPNIATIAAACGFDAIYIRGTSRRSPTASHTTQSGMIAMS